MIPSKLVLLTLLMAVTVLATTASAAECLTVQALVQRTPIDHPEHRISLSGVVDFSLWIPAQHWVVPHTELEEQVCVS